MAQVAAVRSRNRCFTGRVDFHQQQHLSITEYLNEIVIQVAGTAETVRLVNHHQAALRPTTAYGLDHRRDFARVVAVIVDQHHAAAVHRKLAVDLEASTHTLKLRQALDDGFITDAFVAGDGDGSQGVQHVVVARHVH